MDEADGNRRFPWKIAAAVLAFLLLLGAAVWLSTPPRFAWGSWFIPPNAPKNHAAFIIYGETFVQELRIRIHGGNVVYVYVPPDGSRSTRWPRLTGNTRPPEANQNGTTEIELTPPD